MTNTKRVKPPGACDPRDDSDGLLGLYLAPLLAVALVALPGCAPPPPIDPMRKTVATIDGKILTAGDLDEYLRDNLGDESGGEPISAEELDQVKSRLFENFIDEEVLLAEARRREVKVTPEELRSYLDHGPEETSGQPAPGEEHGKMAFRDLMIQKLREASALEGAKVTPADADAYLAQHRDELRSRPVVVLRSFTLASPADAEKMRKKILGMKRKLDEAAAKGDDLGPDAGQRQEVSLDALPEEVRAVLSKMKPGQVSPPVALEGASYLFYYQAGPSDRPDTEEALRARAADALLRERVEEASARLLEKLKRAARIELHEENFPFRYVPDDGRPGGGAGAPDAEGRD